VLLALFRGVFFEGLGCREEQADKRKSKVREIIIVDKFFVDLILSLVCFCFYHYSLKLLEYI